MLWRGRLAPRQRAYSGSQSLSDQVPTDTTAVDEDIASAAAALRPRSLISFRLPFSRPQVNTQHPLRIVTVRGISSAGLTGSDRGGEDQSDRVRVIRARSGPRIDVRRPTERCLHR
jgi:hypothetical protein